MDWLIIIDHECGISANPPGPCFIDGLDEHIWKSLPVSTTSRSSLNPGDIIEMQGPAGSGKTSLLYFLSMTSILPFKLNISYLGRPYEIVLGGRGKAVVVCDCDGQWNSRRLEDIISAYVLSRVQQSIGLESESIDSDNLANDVSPSVSTIVSASLERIHIFRPTSSLAFAATLVALPSYHISSMPDQEICMLMIDSISAFHWPDRWSIDRTATNEVPIHRILTALNELRERFGFVTFITNWSLLPPLSTPIHVRSSQAQLYGKEGPMYAQQHLPPPYPSPFNEINPILLARPEPNRSVLSITHHISLFVKRDSAPSSSVGETLDERRPKERIVAYIRTPVTLEGDLLAHTPVPTANVAGSAPRLQPQVLEGRLEFRLRPDGIIWSSAPPV